MARTDRKSQPSLEEALFKEPYSFEFHQAVKLLEMLTPHAEPFGESEDPANEPVAIKSRVFFESLASDIYSLDVSGKAAYKHNPHYVAWPDDPPQMQVNFMGLAGLPGPLPYAYAELIHQRERSGDPSLRDFLDIFNHRLVSILHRLRKQYIVGLSPLPPDQSPQATALRAFSGILQKHTQDRLATPDRSMLEFAGLLWARPHSAQALSQVLSAYFDVPIEVEQCIGTWREVHEKDRTHIGRRHGQWNTLGGGAMLGKWTWDQQGRVRIHMGPLKTDQFNDLLPGTSGYKSLTDVVEMFISPETDFDINLIVEEDEIEASTLTHKSGLGWNTWLSYIPIGKSAKPLPGKKVKLTDNQVLINPKDIRSLHKQAMASKDSLLYENMMKRTL